MRQKRLATDDPDDLSEQLKNVIDINVSEDGDLDEYDTPTFFGDKDRNSNPKEDEDYTDLDSDFDEDNELYDDMEVSDQLWPQHDWSCLYPYSAINRYMVDYLSLVARIERVAMVLQGVKKRQ